MEFKPGDPIQFMLQVWDMVAAYVFKSTDMGKSWSYSCYWITGGYRAELAVTPNNSAVVYALVCNM